MPPAWRVTPGTAEPPMKPESSPLARRNRYVLTAPLDTHVRCDPGLPSTRDEPVRDPPRSHAPGRIVCLAPPVCMLQSRKPIATAIPRQFNSHSHRQWSGLAQRIVSGTGTARSPCLRVTHCAVPVPLTILWVINTKITKAQAETVLDTATKLFDLIVEANGISEDMPKREALYDKFVFGVLAEVMLDTTL
ncbi:hypothetical protein OKW34_004336 [Paraburkholderia youngii]